jgi:hypothetical protein
VGVYLGLGLYQLSRMPSVYAAVRSFGWSASAAMLVQVIVATSVLALVVVASYRFSVQHALGLTAIASVLVSPYVYDYDLCVIGIGLAMLLPDLMRVGNKFERLAVYICGFFACGFGIVTNPLLSQLSTNMHVDGVTISLAGFASLGFFVLSWRVAQRSERFSDSARALSPIVRESDALAAS